MPSRSRTSSRRRFGASQIATAPPGRDDRRRRFLRCRTYLRGLACARRLKRCAAARLKASRSIDELPEPQLEHHETPKTMAMVLLAVAVRSPQVRDRAIVEHAAIAEASVEQQPVD